MVYDGPALAGKTTNLRALAERLGREIYSGEEADGRTLYLDWVDYLGGRFEGMPIRCQLVSVPGQQVLHRRRRWILEGADAVVFVADSRPSQAAENQRSFALLREVLLSKSPPVGIIVQANKRDVDGAMDLDSLRRQLAGDEPLAMTEAIATEADGVRDTFVFAVRLALDRVRALRDLGRLETRAPDVQDGRQLVEALRREEDGDRPHRAAASETGVAGMDAVGIVGGERGETPPPPATDQNPARWSTSGDPAPSSNRAGPPLPDVMLPLGQVWPPVRGRILIHEATRQGLSPMTQGHTGWLAESPQWWMQSPVGGRFETLAAGQAALQSWIQWHEAKETFLTQERCLALSQDGPGNWRLWQIIGKQPTLGQVLARLIRESEGKTLGRELFRLLEWGQRVCRDLMLNGGASSLDLESMRLQSGSGEEPIRFADLAPFPVGPPVGLEGHTVSSASLVENLAPILRRELAQRPGRVPDLLAGFREAAETRNQGTVFATLRQILLAS